MCRIKLWAIVLVALLVGCKLDHRLITTVPVEDVPDIPIGCTLEELKEALKDKTYYKYRSARGGDSIDVFMASIERSVTHEFTLQRDDTSVLCVSGRIIQPKFYFIFTNGELTKILLASSLGHVYSNPNRTVQRILRAESISHQQLPALVKRITEERNRYRASILEPNPVLLLFPRMTQRDKAANLRTAELQERYDPLQLRLGMTSSKVEEIVGSSVLSELASQAEVVRVYGEEPVSELLPDSFLSVTYRADKCVAIYGHSFLPLSLREAATTAHRNHDPDS